MILLQTKPAKNKCFGNSSTDVKRVLIQRHCSRRFVHTECRNSGSEIIPICMYTIEPKLVNCASESLEKLFFLILFTALCHHHK